jgi:hypothetical protein
MGAVHTKERSRSELSHQQVVMAHVVIGFNGPSVREFAESIDRESKEKVGPEWWGFVLCSPIYCCFVNVNVKL